MKKGQKKAFKTHEEFEQSEGKITGQIKVGQSIYIFTKDGSYKKKAQGGEKEGL